MSVLEASPEVPIEALMRLAGTSAHIEQTMSAFQLCHDLMRAHPDIISEEVVQSIDQCGLDFRVLCKKTTTLAGQVSGRWCETAILYFDNYETLKNPEKILDMICKQAKDLSTGFTAVAQFTQDLSGKLRGKCATAKKHAGTFEEQVEKLELKVNQEKVDLKLKISTEKDAKMAAMATLRHMSGDVKLPKSLISAESLTLLFVIYEMGKAVLAHGKLSYYEWQLQKTEMELSKAEEVNKKDEVYFKKIAELLDKLGQIGIFMNAMAKFWEYQADKFNNLSSNAKDAEGCVGTNLDVLKVKEMSKEIKQSKKTLEEYCEVMRRITTSYNYITKLKATEFPAIKLPELAFQL